MPLIDPSLLGHETAPQSVLITPADIAAFAAAIGESNPVFYGELPARRLGFAGIPIPPTFITRLRVPFAEAGLDPLHTQVLHVEQEYTYLGPVVAGDTLVGRHRVAQVRQSGRGDMALMTLEQLCDRPDGDRVITGKASLIVRNASTLLSIGFLLI